MVGIGASAGGLDGFKRFLTAMPANNGLALVLIPHLAPGHKSLMVELLARHTAMPVVEVSGDIPVEPNHVYVIPPNRSLVIAGGVLKLRGPVISGGPGTAIDLFLASLAVDLKERAVCVILSGTGSYGTPGLKAIKDKGGMAMVQAPETAEFDQMPRSAIATGLVDHVLPIEQMPPALLKHLRLNDVDVGRGSGGGEKSEGQTAAPEVVSEDIAGSGPDQAPGSDVIGRILSLLRVRTRHDFRGYRAKMVRRRMERRMALHHFDDLGDYLVYLRNYDEEVDLLSRDLLINVTSFFRDPEAFEVLATRVVAEVVREKNPDTPIRVWVPGCSTGEEAYSIAILFLEQLALAKKDCRLQVFATDIFEDALATARAGLYPQSIATSVSPERLSRFFTLKEDHTYKVSSTLRESVLFAQQNVIGDAPFSRLDLLSCRNLMIYLEPEEQHKVIALGQFALNEGGYLFLGPSETIGREVDRFSTISKRWRIYRRTGSGGTRIGLPVAATKGLRTHDLAPPEPPKLRAPGYAEQIQRFLLEDLPVAAVLINRGMEVLHFFGPTAKYISQPAGEPTRNLLVMSREGLRTRLRAAVQRASSEQKRVTLNDVRVKREGGYATIQVSVRPVDALRPGDSLLLVVFRDQAEPEGHGTTSVIEPSAGESALVEQLENDLRDSREDLQSTIEELESSNEELRSSNEEVRSMNEELQSANEELESSKEELQSLNEEMATVNNQLQEKVVELESAGNDMTNLLESTNLAMIFLDRSMRIKMFTPDATKLFSLIPTDIARPIRDIVQRFDDAELLRDAEQVLAHLSPREAEVGDATGGWWIRRITPYRTADHHIEGVVLTFVNIAARRLAEEELRQLALSLERKVSDRTAALRQSEGQLRSILDSATDAILSFDVGGTIQSANPATSRIFLHAEGALIGKPLACLIPSPYLETVQERIRERRDGRSVGPFAIDDEILGRRSDGHHFPLDLAINEVVRGRLYTAILRDVSHRKELEREVTEIAAIEQQRIGQELHDGVGQELTGLAMMADGLAQQLSGGDPTSSSLAERIAAELSRVNRVTRDVCRGLVSVEIEADNLRGALEELGNQAFARHGQTFTIDCSDPAPVSGKKQATHLFRIAQEAVNNALRHGNGSAIALSLKSGPTSVTLTVQDDGVGMTDTGATTGGVGIRVMRSRASLLHGQLSIRGGPTGGTVVTCEIPREEDNAPA